MKLEAICNTIEKEYPTEMTASWDHVGLMVGDKNADIKSVLISLDADDRAIEEAAANRVDLLVTHHPLLFEAVHAITEDNLLTRRVRRLVKENIKLYVMLTNFDILKMGDLNARDMQIEFPEVLEPVAVDEKSGEGLGFGKIGSLKEPMPLETYAGIVKKAARLSHLRVYGDPQKIIRKVAVSSGAGKSGIYDALQKGADVMVTGDLTYHYAVDAVACGLAMIDAGHYGTEYVFIDEMQRYIKEKFPELKLFTREITQAYQIL